MKLKEEEKRAIHDGLNQIPNTGIVRLIDHLGNSKRLCLDGSIVNDEGDP